MFIGNIWDMWIYEEQKRCIYLWNICFKKFHSITVNNSDFNFILFFQAVYFWWSILFLRVEYFQMAICDLHDSMDHIWYSYSLDMENDSPGMYYPNNRKCQIRWLDIGPLRRILWLVVGAAFADFPYNFATFAVHEQISRD